MTPRLRLSKKVLSIGAALAFGPVVEALATVQLAGIRHSVIEATPCTRTRKFRLFPAQDEEKVIQEEEDAPSAIEQELERLKDQLTWIEALEARNEAQIDSFVDEEDQWNSMEEEDRALLESKESVLQRMELLTEQMIQLWMGQKSMEG